MHVLGELESALSEQTPPTQQENPSLHELPHLVMDGIPTPVDKMTQVCGIYTGDKKISILHLSCRTSDLTIFTCPVN